MTVLLPFLTLETKDFYQQQTAAFFREKKKVYKLKEKDVIC